MADLTMAWYLDEHVIDGYKYVYRTLPRPHQETYDLTIGSCNRITAKEIEFVSSSSCITATRRLRHDQ